MKCKEIHLQRAVAIYLNGLELAGELAWCHPPNGMRSGVRQGASLKAQGMKAGQPDCEIFLKGGTTIFIELKTTKNSLQPPQKRRHKILQDMGYAVFTVKAANSYEAVKAVELIIEGKR